MRTARFPLLAAIAAFAALLVLPIRPAFGASYAVDTPSDSAALTACTVAAADCSLRGAISNANASGAADTITFDPAVFPVAAPATIALASVLPNLAGFGDTIDGAGAGVIVDAVNTEPDPAPFACFTVQANGVTIKGLQITDCNRGVWILTGFGNTTVGPANVIYDNGSGVWNDSSGGGNKILGNMIGTTADGTAVNANGGNITGIFAVGSGTAIGGTGAGEGNVISGSVTNGLVIQGSNITVQGNMIGTDVSGTLDVGNAMDGVVISGTASAVTIGGATAAARNVISGNNRHGIYLSTANAATVQGNYIGIDASGTADLGNSQGGVVVTAGSKSIYQNVISGNDQAGVHLTASGNLVQANLIGLNAAGTAAVGNGGAGVLIDNLSTNNGVGGAGASFRNVISGNGGAGVELTFSTSGNPIKGNYIGTNISGTAAVPNAGAGVKLTSSGSNAIGGSAPGEGNLISGNTMSGIEFNSAANSLVYGNFIGTQADGTTALGNGNSGVLITSGASGNAIGSGGSYANVIAFNAGAGIWVQDGTGNFIASNSIHSNGGLGIDLSVTGVTANDPGDPDTGANNRQNFPVLSLARTDGSTLVVDGSLNSLSSTPVGIHLYQNDVCDGSGHGEGRTFLAFNTYTTDAGGNVTFSKSLAVSVPAGQFITATASAAANTSEFSACVVVQQDTDMDGVPDAADSDDDNDGFTDEAEAGAPLCANAVNDDAPDDAVVDDGCPGGPAQAGAFSEADLHIGTNPLYPCGYNSWPADLWDQPPLSANKITVQDLTSFIAPVRRLSTSPGNPNFSARWDLVPGKGIFSETINVQDMTALVTLAPPMLNGARALNGPVCPLPSQ